MKKIKRGSVVAISFNNSEGVKRTFCGIALNKHKTKGWYVITDNSATYWPESEVKCLFNITGRKTTFDYSNLLQFIIEWPKR